MLGDRTPELVMRLEGFGFKTVPNADKEGYEGYVTLRDKDGVYFNISRSRPGLQIIIVGPLTKHPQEYADQIGGFEITEAHPIPATKASLKRRVFERGFYSIIMQKMVRADGIEPPTSCV